MSNKHRKIWAEHFGEIPVDSDGRTYEIHHIDGDHNNNSLDNLLCCPIKQHYKLHYERGDYGAAVLIAKRMNLPPDHISKIQLGKKRPGVGGRKPGFVSPRKGTKRGDVVVNKEARERRATSSQKTFVRRWKNYFEKLVTLFEQRPLLPEADKKQKNGRTLPYERAFSKVYYKEFPVTTAAGLYRVLCKIELLKEVMRVQK